MTSNFAPKDFSQRTGRFAARTRLLLLLPFLFTAACAGVRSTSGETFAEGMQLTRPPVLVVYDFAVSADDLAADLYGEEFAITLPETGIEGGGKIGEELRRLVETHHFEFEGEVMNITISLGGAELQDSYDVIAFIKHADDRLYEAKRGGRNRVAI